MVLPISTRCLSIHGFCTYYANMLQFPSNTSRAPSHFALVDSGASIHILTCHTFLSDAVVNHSAVASFAGSTSRATHKGTFAALVQCTNNKFHRLVQKNSALVVPDASRRHTHGHVFIASRSPTLTSQWHIPSPSNSSCSPGYFYTEPLPYTTCNSYHAIPTLGYYPPQHIGPYRAPS